MCVYKPVRWGWGCEVAYLGRRSWDPNEIKARDLLGPGHNRMFDYYANHARALKWPRMVTHFRWKSI